MKPVNGNILIDYKQTEPTKSASGLIIPVDNKSASRHAVVINPGDSKLAEAGQTVLFEDWAMVELQSEGKTIYFIHEDGVVAVIG